MFLVCSQVVAMNKICLIIKLEVHWVLFPGRHVALQYLLELYLYFSGNYFECFFPGSSLDFFLYQEILYWFKF